jgi:hypothetical protein
MGYLAERLMQTIFVPAGFPFSSLFSLHRPPEFNSMKWDGIPQVSRGRLSTLRLQYKLGRETARPNRLPGPERPIS